MNSAATRNLGGIALAAALLGCSSGGQGTRSTPTGVVGSAGDPIPSETDGADPDEPNAGEPGNGDDSDEDPGLPVGDCSPGATAPCYGGPPGTINVGICHAGVARCGNDGQWGSCDGWMAPMAEACNGSDDDCNGVPDDPSQECNTGLPGPCGTGAAGCDGGAVRCIPFVQPAAAETCNDGVDNDCNGEVDDGCGSPGGDTGGNGPCDPLNPLPVCGPGARCYGSPDGQTTCAGPTGFGLQYDECFLDAQCAPDHICVNVGEFSYCMQWCVDSTQCAFFEDDCRSVEPALFVGTQEYGICWDGLP